MNKASIYDQIQRHKSYQKRSCVKSNKGQALMIQDNVSYESNGYRSPSNERDLSQMIVRPKTKSKSITSNKSDVMAINESFTIQNCYDRQSIQFQNPKTPTQSRLSQNTKLTASFIGRRTLKKEEEVTFQQQQLKLINSKIPEMRKSHLNIQKTLKLKNVQKKYASTEKKQPR